MRFPARIWLALAAPAAVALALAAALWRPLGPVTALVLGSVTAAVVASLAAWRWDREFAQPLERLESIARQLARGEAADRSGLATGIALGPLAQALDELSQRSQRQVADARAEGDHLRAILASVPEGILVTDSKGLAELVNPAFLEMFGAVEPVSGRSPLELSRHPLLHDLVNRALAGGGPQQGEISLDDSERRELQISVLELPQRAGVVLLARDVTAELRLAEMRRDFVANVSHELKTPLAAIRAYAETLRDGALDEPQTATRFVERVIAQSRRLQTLLEDLLTLSRLESVGRSPERQPLDLALIAKRALETVATMAEERNVQLALDSRGPLRYSGDTDAIERLLLNLLENAIKYNRPGGSVRVHVSSHPGAAVVSVTDSGIGIPAESLPRIFERFYRVDKARSREEGGTGLGLAIVKHVAQSHGGRVEVESEFGKGTTFRVVLPTD